MITKQYKKWLLSAAALLAGAACAEAQVTESAEYLLKLQDSNLYLSAETAKAGESSELSLNGVCEPGFVQTVVFTQATGGYNLTFGQRFAAARDQWYMRYKNTSGVNLSSADAIFAVEASGDGIMLKNLGSGKYIGCDNRGDGSKVYSDKTGDAVCVFVLESPAVVYRQIIGQEIEDARALLSGTEEGTEIGQYPAEARQEFDDNISKAETVKNNETATSAELIGAIGELRDAVSTYKTQAVKPEFQEGVYKLHHVANGGCILASGWHANSWESDNTENTALIIPEANLGGYNGEFTFSKAADSENFNILDKDNKPLVNANGKLYVGNNSALSDANALFAVDPAADGEQVRIRSLATGKNVGPVDNTKGWSWIHAGTNHTGTDNGDLFRAELIRAATTGIEEVAAGEDFSVSVRNNTVVLEGAFGGAVVYNVTGAIVAEMTGSEVALPAGVYIVAVNTPDGSRSVKILVK